MSSAAPEPNITPPTINMSPNICRLVMTSPKNTDEPINVNTVFKFMKIAAFDGPAFPTE